MPSPIPKPAGLRQRTNRPKSHATLIVPAARPHAHAPLLPVRNAGAPGWHVLTEAWWRDVWQSPMAAEYLAADIHRLYVLAELVDQFWQAPRVELATEIRQQGQAFGLTPLDRRRLEWEVQRVEAAEGRKVAPRRVRGGDDPRALLRVVS